MTRVVQLSDEAYGLLKSLKKRDESFSDVVMRLAGGRSLRGLHKILSPKDGRNMLRSIREIDKLDRP